MDDAYCKYHLEFDRNGNEGDFNPSVWQQLSWEWKTQIGIIAKI
jgi:hypothetical protein